MNGVFGGFYGRIGNLVGYTLKGKYVIRKIGKSYKPLTPGRKANCQKMTLVNEILSPSLPVIRVGFRMAVAGTDKNEYNEAVSYNKKNAIQGVYPNLSLDYTRVLMSMGTLPVAIDPTLSQTDDKITFSWKVTPEHSGQYASDRAMLVVYFPDLKITCADLSGSKRLEGTHTLQISEEHINERMETYISFVKNNGREVSNSVYAGALNVRKTPEVSEKINPESIHSKQEVKYAGSDFDIISYRKYLLDTGISDVETKSGPEKLSNAWSIYILNSKTNNQRIGDCYLRLKKNEQFTAEMKVSIIPAEQGKGYAKEASSAMIPYLFNKLKINRIVKIVDAQDKAAIALLKSLGFKEEEYFKDSVFSDGKWVSEYQFALLKSDWDIKQVI